MSYLPTSNIFNTAVDSYTVGANTAASSSDTLLQMLGKLQGQVNARQATLVSATNIKTINGSSILGSGDLAITSLTTLDLSAGAGTIAPLSFAAGTLKASPLLGDVEVDSLGILYYSQANSSRGVVGSVQEIVLSGTSSLTNGTGAQAAFSSTSNDAITLTGATTYEFEALYIIQSGATSHATNIAFGGTATLTSIGYYASTSSATAAATISALSSCFIATASSTAVTAAGTNTFTRVYLRGIIRVNAAGTLIPQMAFSVAPSTTTQMLAQSFFRIWPIGTNTVVTVGNWG